MIKYKTCTYCCKPIEKVEVRGETAKMVILKNGRRETKWSRSVSYHDTFDEAKQWLVSLATERVEDAERVLESALARIREMKMLQEPQE